MEIKESLKLRLVNSKFDQACLIGFTIAAEYNLTDFIDRCRFIITRDFSSENQEQYKELKSQEMQINIDLRKYLVESTYSRSNLFKDYHEISRLLKPNGLIMKPIFCVYVLRHMMPK